MIRQKKARLEKVYKEQKVNNSKILFLYSLELNRSLSMVSKKFLNKSASVDNTLVYV
jgi:hypothetical protein